MKSLLLFLFLFPGINLLAQSQTKDEIEIQNLIQNSFEVLFSNFDSDRIGEFYTDDFLLLENGEVWDMAKTLSYFEQAKKNPNPPVRTNKFEYFKTKVEGNRGWIGYWNYATFTRNGEVVRDIKWLESATATKTANGWRLDTLHSSPVK